MTIDDAIKRLQDIKAKHGETVRVYFDCPQCQQSFPLGRAYVAVVIKAETPLDVQEEIAAKLGPPPFGEGAL